MTSSHNKAIKLMAFPSLVLWFNATLPQNNQLQSHQFIAALGNSMTGDGLEQLAEAIFSKEGAIVAEAYSSFGKMPVHFKTAFELARYFMQQLSHSKGLVDVVVTYPDMEGTAELERIQLDPEKCNGHTERYSYRGWGLITVQISNNTKTLTRVSANTEKRANKWAETYPEILPPNSWQWGAVTSHARRLQRVLKRVT